MEHQKTSTKAMSKILNFLPRATSSVSFQHPQLYSPARDKRSSEKTHKSHIGIGFSGPMVPLVSPETRRKIKNDKKSSYTTAYEPTSPRVSCMGQVKCKHYRKLTGKATNRLPNNKFSRTTSYAPVRTYYNTEEDQEKVENVIKTDMVVVKRKQKLGILRLFMGRRKSTDASDHNMCESKIKKTLGVEKAPCLSTMKRFSSGRDAFMSFDWTTQVAPLDGGRRSCCSDDDGEAVMAASAPVTVENRGVGDGFVRVGGVKVEERKEINLWKRRMMAQPQPLQVHVANKFFFFYDFSM